MDMRGAGGLGRAARLALAVVLAWAAGRLPVPAFVVSPGPAVPAAELVHVEGGRPRGAPILVVTVVAAPARLGDALEAAWRADRDVWPRHRVLGPQGDLDAYLRAGRRALRESQQLAAYVALRQLGRPVRLEARPEGLRLVTPVAVRFALPDVAGPSAGLAFALEIIRQLEPRAAPAAPVAATGTLFPDGRIGAVGGVGLKVRAAERAGARLVLVPAGNAPEAYAAARRARVVPVGDVSTAARLLLTAAEAGPYNGSQFGRVTP